MRPGSASLNASANFRPGTGLARPGTASFGLARPATQQGLQRPSTAGRQVQDASYFIALLRNRISEITTETARLRTDTDRASRDVAAVATYEKQYEALMKGVRGLEGDLADYNLALDKARTNADAGALVAFAAAQRRRNEASSRDADALFIERADRERGCAKLEEAIAELQRAATERINSLSPAQIAEYHALVEENGALTAAISDAQAELEGLSAAIDTAEAEIRRDRVRDEYAALEKRLGYLRKERAALEDELGTRRLDPAEARERLLNRVKEDNARIQATDARLREVAAETEAKRRTAAEVAADIDERRGETGDASKYEALFLRDQEMTEFIERFPSLREKEVAEHRRLRESISELVDQISNGLGHGPQSSTTNQQPAVPEVDETTIKALVQDVSHMPPDRLCEELVLRSSEMEKIAGLDARIAEELRALDARSSVMQEEMLRFADVPGLRAAAEHTKTTLLSLIKEHGRRRDALKPEFVAVTGELEKRRAELLRDPQATALDALEAKLKIAEQNVYQLREFIAARSRESNYDALKLDCTRVVGEINLLLQRAQTKILPSVTATGGGSGVR